MVCLCSLSYSLLVPHVYQQPDLAKSTDQFVRNIVLADDAAAENLGGILVQQALSNLHVSKKDFDGAAIQVRESGHQYSNNEDKVETIHIPEATSLYVTFDPRCATEEGYDHLTFFALSLSPRV